jgi:hypothetical protein
MHQGRNERQKGWVAPLYRLRCTAYTEARPVEINMTTLVSERFELFCELPAQ